MPFTGCERAGFLHDLVIGPDAGFICSCGQNVAAQEASVLHTVCFEGAANAEDQSILLAVATPCRHAALFRSAFGPAAALGDPHTSSALRRMSGTSTLETTGDGYLQRIGSAVVCLAR